MDLDLETIISDILEEKKQRSKYKDLMITKSELDYSFSRPADVIDSAARLDAVNFGGYKSIEEAYPVLLLAREKKDKGCYMFYEDYETHILPLYIGRTVKLITRLNMHWREEKWIEKYCEGLENDDFIGNTCFCVWVIEDKEIMIQKEHQLIGKHKTVFNKA